MDGIVRDSYRGGATEVYKCSGNNLYYYDVNSLYPTAMLNDMPYKFLGYRQDFVLSSFFGFVDATICVPDEVFNPFLPVKDVKTGNVIYPYGSFRGIYFSEELKVAEAHGYFVKINGGYEFTRKKLFEEYVEHFYNKNN